MKTRSLRFFVICSLVVLLVFLVHNSASAFSRLTVTDLGMFGGTQATPTAINDLGHVVGYISNGNGCFLWIEGQATDLGTLGGSSCVAEGINNADWVVGRSTTVPLGSSHAFLWVNGNMTDLGTLGDGPFSSAYDINETDQITGHTATAPDPGGNPPVSAFLWENDVMQDIASGLGRGINDSEQIVGHTSGGLFSNQAFLWENGNVTFLGNLGGLGWSQASDINNLGQAVGKSSYTDLDDYWGHAYLWQNGNMTDLGSLGGNSSQALAINDLGQIVGRSENAEGRDSPFLWENGAMVDVNGLIDPALGIDITYVSDINNLGQIVGKGWVNGEEHALLLTPDPNHIVLPPVAEAGPDQVAVDDATLDASQSTDPDGTIESYEWILNYRGDANYNRTANGVNPVVSDLQPGIYDVILTVTDDDGLTGTDTMVLTVFNAPKITNVLLYKNGTDLVQTTSFDIGDSAYFAVDAKDLDLDMTTLYISQYYPSNSTNPYHGPDSLTLPAQPATETVYYNLNPITVNGPAGDWRVTFMIEDSQGNTSNVFEISVSVIDPSVSSTDDGGGGGGGCFIGIAAGSIIW